jgi:hypothetical protein
MDDDDGDDDYDDSGDKVRSQMQPAENCITVDERTPNPEKACLLY